MSSPEAVYWGNSRARAGWLPLPAGACAKTTAPTVDITNAAAMTGILRDMYARPPRLIRASQGHPVGSRPTRTHGCFCKTLLVYRMATRARGPKLASERPLPAQQLVAPKFFEDVTAASRSHSISMSLVLPSSVKRRVYN